jgi:hypothetical protein
MQQGILPEIPGNNTGDYKLHVKFCTEKRYLLKISTCTLQIYLPKHLKKNIYHDQAK